MDTFTVLADPTRRQLLERLSRGEAAFGALAERFAISRPAVSQHLKVLRDSGLVSVRRDAQRRIYRLEPRAFDDIDRWLREVRRFWSPRLDRLQQALNEDGEAS